MRLPTDTLLPFGGVVQWVADYFANQWSVADGPTSEFAALMRAISAPSPLVLPSEGAEPAAGPSAFVQYAASALCAQRRRYYRKPKLKPRHPENADVLMAEAMEAVAQMVTSIVAIVEPK